MINCTGAGTDLRRQAPPLLAGLLAGGRARPDELGLGLDVSEDGALLGADGTPLGAPLRDRRPAQGGRVGGDRDHRDPRPLRRRRPQDRPDRRNRRDPAADRAAARSAPRRRASGRPRDPARATRPWRAADEPPTRPRSRVALASDELAAGRMVLLRDDCERRGEGDLLIAAEFADAAADQLHGDRGARPGLRWR